MCVGLWCPYRNGFSGFRLVAPNLYFHLYFRLMFVEFMSKPDWLKKVECQQSSIFKLPFVRDIRDKTKSEEAKFVFQNKKQRFANAELSQQSNIV